MVQGWRRGLGSELQQSRRVLFSPLPYGAIKGQNPLEVPVRRWGAGPLPPPEPCLLVTAPTSLPCNGWERTGHRTGVPDERQGASM